MSLNAFPWPETTDGQNYFSVPRVKLIKRITKTVEKLDAEGNVIEKKITTKDHEIVEKTEFDGEYGGWWNGHSTTSDDIVFDNCTITTSNTDQEWGTIYTAPGKFDINGVLQLQ